MSYDSSPQKEGEESGRDNDSLHEEENSQLLDIHTRQNGLADPIQEKAKQASGCNPSAFCHRRGESAHTCYSRTFWEVIGEPLEARPDGFDAVSKEVSCLDTKNGSPHGSDEG